VKNPGDNQGVKKKGGDGSEEEEFGGEGVFIVIIVYSQFLNRTFVST